jgi:hypothetical protein
MVFIISSVVAWGLFLLIARKNPIRGLPKNLRGMRGGCGAFDEPPDYQVPAAAQYKQSDQLLQAAIDWANKNYPEAMGAQASAIKDLGRGTDYYKDFQPTSFEDALASQYFQNVMPDVERSIKQNMSLSGLSNSPILAEMIGKERGNLGVSIGEYLSNLGNTRATNSLNARLNIAPADVYGPYLNTDINQSNMQTNANYETAMANALNNYNKGQQLTQNELAASKVMSILDPGGSYMGTWKNPNKPGAYGAQEMQGLGKVMELYSAYKGGNFQDSSQKSTGTNSVPIDSSQNYSLGNSQNISSGNQNVLGGSLSDYFNKNYNMGYSYN